MVTQHPLTEDEYIARAMLLGRIYDPRTHSLWCISGAALDSYHTDIDADTLEGISPAEVERRLKMEGVRS
jgi:uncharacterized protein (UPF0332 family)